MNNLNNATPSSSQKNLLDTAAADGHYVTFGKAVEKAALGETLRGAGPFTIFAPTDAAFEKLPVGKLDNLFKPENKEELVALVNFHVIKGRKMAADIGKWASATMVNGQSTPVKLANGKISIGDASVVSADISSSNGVIHGIDKVNLPAPTKH
jgi:uncharacterized surface protein with fasciclin (FAS1) repeats